MIPVLMHNHLSVVAAGLTLDVDGTVFVQMALFLFVIAFLQSVLFRPFLRTWEARQEGVHGSRESAADADAQAAVLMGELEQKMRAIRRDAQDVRETLRNQGLHEQQHILDDIREEVNQSLGQERAKISSKVDEAHKEMTTRASTLAESMVNKLLPSA